MNTRALPPSCDRCGGEGSIDGDHGDETCLTCGGSGEARPPARTAGIVAALCLGAAFVGYFAPVAWWAS